MKTLIKTFLLLLLPLFATAQNTECKKRLEILKVDLSNSKADTTRVLLLSELCLGYLWYNSDSLEFYSKQGLELAKQLQFHKGGAKILNCQGIFFAFHGNSPKALAILFRALRIAEENKLTLETANCLCSIGMSYWFLNDSAKANAFINRGVKLDETVQHTPNDIYWRILTQVWSGVNYIKLNKLDSANISLKKAYDNALNPGFTDLYSVNPTILMFSGEVQSKLGNKESAINYLHRSIAYFIQNNDALGAADACNIIAEVFKDLNQRDSVIYYSNLGLEAGLKFDYKPAILRNSKMLAEQYELTDTKQANYYWKMVLVVKDSLFGEKKIQELQKTLSEEQRRQELAQELQTERENQLKQYGFGAGLGVLSLVVIFLYRNNRQKQKANTVLQEQKEKVESTLTQLKATQNQLIQSEKLASLGELTAGIAHEIQNPLNFVNNFSVLSVDLTKDLNEEIDREPLDKVFIKELMHDLTYNQESINHHGKRAASIVTSMLEHSRLSTGVKELTDVNKLADEYFRLSFHGLRAKDKDFNSDMISHFDKTIPKIEIVPQDVGRVILNLINNAFYAVNEKRVTVDEERRRGLEPQRRLDAGNYSPTVTVSTKKLANAIEIRVKDNGTGMSEAVRAKVFQPFFTTKPPGQGTGLGLSLAYDIITKGHGGQLKVESTEGVGSEFIIQLSNKT